MERLAESKWFEIFRVGTWNGLEYDKDDLDTIVENFEKGDPRAPLIIGHNSFWGGDEKPAHGWVSALKRSGKRLMAKARNVSAELVAAVNDEVYPMRSIELWHNYQERGMALGAIAFLGGSNPAVGGMADFQFSLDGADAWTAGQGAGRPIFAREKEGRVCFSYGSTEKLEAETGSQKLQQHHRGGGDMNEEQMKAAIDKAIAEATPKIVEQFKSGAEFTQLTAANEKLASELEATRNQAAAAVVKADVESCQAFAKGLLEARKIRPAHFNAGLGGFLASLDNVEKFKFAADKEQTRREYIMELLTSLPEESSLFSHVDNGQARSGEDEGVSSEIEQFAKKHGLDPKIVAAQFAAQRRGVASTSAEDDGGVMGVSVSLAAAKPAKAE